MTPSKTKRFDIMIVDDNPANLKLLADMLVRRGYKVRSFPLGRLALAAASKNPPDLILLDINMPEMNGYEVCEQLKATGMLSEIPVIFLSALSELQDKVKAFRSGAADYISKPFHFEEVHARVETHLHLHDLQRLMKHQNESLEEVVAARTLELAERLNQVQTAKNNLEHEIREHRSTEAALRGSEERYRLVAETVTDAIITINQAGLIQFVNPAAERIFGYSEAKMLGQSLTMLMPEYLCHVHDPGITGYEAGAERRIDRNAITIQGFHENGKEIPLEIAFGEVRRDGKLNFTGIVRDITGQKQAEALMRQSEAQYRLLFQLNPHPMWVYEKSSLQFLAVNNAASQNYGYSADEFLNMTLRDICTSDSVLAQDAIDGVPAPLPIGATRFYKNKAGGIITAEITQNPIQFAGQDALLTTATDITERKQLEEQFHQAQRLDSVGRLAGGVAHDFNNLLTVINGYAEMAVSELTPDNTMRDSLGEILRAGERAAALTKQLLAFSRRQLVQPTVVNLNTIVIDVQSMLERLIGEDIDLRTILAPNLGNVLVDVGQIQQIIVNLVINSREAMRDGGTLSIETSETYASPHPGVDPLSLIILSVTDTVTGMSPEVVQRIFEPFFTTKPKDVGTGLGLSTVYGLVKQAGGWIQVYSEPGRGTKFQVYFPRIDQPLTEVRPTVQTHVAGNKTILVVEDQPEVRQLALSALKKFGYKVYGAGSGDEALKFARDFSGAIDLVLTDVVMPGMNGLAMINQFKLLRPQVKVLFMSGYTDDVIADSGVLEAGLAYLEKPFTATSLGNKVSAICGATQPITPDMEGA